MTNEILGHVLILASFVALAYLTWSRRRRDNIKKPVDAYCTSIKKKLEGAKRKMVFVEEVGYMPADVFLEQINKIHEERKTAAWV